MIEAMNASDNPIIAVDIPSGIHADSGKVLGAAVRAEHTVSFIGLKQGLFSAEAPDYVGQLSFNDLKVPTPVYQHVTPSAERICWPGVQNRLPPRASNGHKGDYGHVLIIGGDYGMAGAVRLAAESALRVGAGLVSVVTRQAHTVAMAASLPEVMWLDSEDPNALRSVMARADVIAVGPGLGQSPWGQKMLAVALDCNLPLVVDADGLNLLAQERYSRKNWVLTPHPGEAGRLLEKSSREINQQRFDNAKYLAEKFNAQVVLKGHGSLVASPEGCLALCTDGNPGMATAGMGDTLTGIIAGLIAQGLSLYDSTCVGVSMHAAAGDLAAQRGERGLVASDVISCLQGLEHV